ncbi:ABC transporter substrate-binding protein [Pollutimonas thiosulfatoxidans]|uniref:Glycine/betaine ABC transporter substrate-binding protein n=1 Tax=Pollutimonas thiosulfatoxidans TaxID=2028345 RepID=A0A410GD71_9BURK|nr:ABC transporter substrate-binding protein [Pollutimonas thiosulfatoxidans]QAA94248.1 glycine/betaine ABC transporter substrate-binding protein [Pollutimonas thiosulfatoxidans]
MKILNQLSISLLAAAAVIAAPAYAFTPESSDPIKIVDNNWSSQKVLARVAQQLLENIGYETKIVPSDSQGQFAAMGLGDLHLQMEVWEGTMDDSFMKEVQAGRMVDLGSHTATTREDWWYPLYMEDICPGLPAWEALNACADKFAAPETAPKGRYLAGPVDWIKHDHEKIDALNLNFTVINAGSAAALFGELKSAAARKEPIVLFNWAPNWVGAAFPGKFVEFPEHEKACTEDPSWGVNPDKTYDCGSPQGGYLKKAAWSGFEEKWTCGYQLIKNIDFTGPMIDQAAALADVEGMAHDVAATAWIENNQEQVAAWTPACAS